MTGTCQFEFGGDPGEAAWSYDESSLTVTPANGSPLVFGLAELCGVAGDDYTIHLFTPGEGGPRELVLSRLGHDGPTLAEALRRDWLLARTDVLRLTGTGEGWTVRGQVSGLNGVPVGPSTTEPFQARLYEDLMVNACEGRDLEPLFLALVESVSFDEDSYSVRLGEWPGRQMVFSKLGKQTDEFVDRVTRSRVMLSGETSACLAAAAPDLPAAGRATLAGLWMPGRLMQLSHMDSVCPGFEQSFGRVWLTGVLRRDEASYLMDGVSPAEIWLGCTREGGGGPGADGRGSGEEAAERPLWMLAHKGTAWYLESLTIEDRATYCFKGGEEVPGLVSKLLCAPQFSKEALYTPLEQLTGDDSDLAIPAAHLDFLRGLRERFTGRIIHQSVDSWKREVDKLG